MLPLCRGSVAGVQVAVDLSKCCGRVAATCRRFVVQQVARQTGCATNP